MEDAKTTFGRRLRLIRKAHDLTLEELGEKAALGFKHVAAIERGEKTASFDAIDRLAKALKVQPYELFLPFDADSRHIDQACRQLFRDIDANGSDVLKRYLLVALPLLRQFEGEI
jgi:transcriptional regulator with XRE-family HTH domain